MGQANPFQPNYSNAERSTGIKIYVQQSGGSPIEIGGISEMTITESRSVTEHYAFGSGQTDEPRVLIPGVRTAGTIRCNRLAMWKSNIVKVFTNVSAEGYISSLLKQKAPFDIIETKEKADDPTQLISITYKDCYITDSTRTQQTSNVAIVENVTIKFTNMIDV